MSIITVKINEDEISKLGKDVIKSLKNAKKSASKVSHKVRYNIGTALEKLALQFKEVDLKKVDIKKGTIKVKVK